MEQQQSTQAGVGRAEAVAERAVLLAEKSRWAAAWAQAHAERGDYEYALKWLELARKCAGRLSPEQYRQRERWRSELRISRSA